MKIFDIIDQVLSSMNVAFYDSFVDNGKERPDLYIVYNLYDTSSLYGDGVLLMLEYIITFNIIGDSVVNVDCTQQKLMKVLQENGFVYAGCNYAMDSDYPNMYRRIIDFKINLEAESEE